MHKDLFSLTARFSKAFFSLGSTLNDRLTFSTPPYTILFFKNKRKTVRHCLKVSMIKHKCGDSLIPKAQKNEKSKIALEGTCSGNVVGGCAATEDTLSGPFVFEGWAFGLVLDMA